MNFIEFSGLEQSSAFKQIDHKYYFYLGSQILEKEDFQNKTAPFKVVSQKIFFR